MPGPEWLVSHSQSHLGGITGALLVAVLWDALRGEWPNAVHPVAWMGRVCTGFERFAPQAGRGAQLVWGVIVAVALPALFAGGAALLLSLAAPWRFLQWLLLIWLLKSTFAIRGLGDAGLAVAASLRTGDLERARDGLRALCSRDARSLPSGQVSGAAVESLAENASDSIVAPLFYLCLFGVPGAVAYRAVNTLDARIGYRGHYEYLGKAAARLDDLLNYLPARMTAVLLLGIGWWLEADAHRGWVVARRDARRTESPNAGWPMAVMAGLLGVRLRKEGYYDLGDGRADPGPDHIDSAWRIVRGTAATSVIATALILWGRHVVA